MSHTSPELRFEHSLKWFDTAGIEHLHVIRSDDLGNVLRQVRAVKAFAASQAQPQALAPQPSRETNTPEPENARLDQYYSPAGLAERLPDFSEGQIRWHLFNREHNGLDKHVSKVGSRLYITVEGWNAWVAEQAERKG